MYGSPSSRNGRDPLRILITRLSAIGDSILTTPVAAALRAGFPGALIAWACEPATAQCLRGNPDVDHVIRLPRRWMKSPGTILNTRRTLRSYQFHIAVDPQGLTKSSLLGYVSGARMRIGFSRGQAREISPWLNNCRVEPQREHIVDRQMELLRPLGIHSAPIQFRVPHSADAAARVHTFLQKTCLTEGFAVINPGAGWPSKLWPAKRFASVAKHVGQTHQLPSVVVWAGLAEREWAEHIVARSGGQAWLAPATNLIELAELVRAARLFVGSDTGPLHLAAAAGVPCVGLYGPTDPRRCGPYGPGHLALQKARVPGGSRQRRRADNQSMLAIEVNDVCQACDQLLSRANQSNRTAGQPIALGASLLTSARRRSPDQRSAQVS